MYTGTYLHNMDHIYSVGNLTVLQNIIIEQNWEHLNLFLLFLSSSCSRTDCRTKRPLLAPVQALLHRRNEKHLQYIQIHMEPHALILQCKFSGGCADWKSIIYSHYKHISFVVVVFFFFLTITKQTILRTSSKSNARLWHLWWRACFLKQQNSSPVTMVITILLTKKLNR